MKTMKTSIALPKIICGFPGVGKSTLVRAAASGWVLDSDSSKFDKQDFPANYLGHLSERSQVGYTILASAHQEVRDGLIAQGMPFVLVYPALNCKDEYLERYRKRGSPESFVQFMADNWVDFIVGCSQQQGCHHVCLGAGKFIPTIEDLEKLIQPAEPKGNH